MPVVVRSRTAAGLAGLGCSGPSKLRVNPSRLSASRSGLAIGVRAGVEAAQAGVPELLGGGRSNTWLRNRI
jgi:hypothetical protein